jgi:hypothetical protein
MSSSGATDVDSSTSKSFLRGSTRVASFAGVDDGAALLAPPARRRFDD